MAKNEQILTKNEQKQNNPEHLTQKRHYMDFKYFQPNPRKISGEQEGDLKKWIEEFGDLSGITLDINTNQLITGNQRSKQIDIDKCTIEYVVAPAKGKKKKEIDWTGTVAYGYLIAESGIRMDYREVKWDAEKCRRANIIANKAGGIFDEEMLSNDFEALELSELGFSEDDLKGIFINNGTVNNNSDDNKDENNETTPEISKDAETVKGDLWELGRHLLLCGDARMIDNIEKLTSGDSVDLVFTDPPYGIDIVRSKKGSVGSIGDGGPVGGVGSIGSGKVVKSKKYPPIIGDTTIESAREFYSNCLASNIENYIIWGGNYFTNFLDPSPCWVIWDKQNTGDFADVEMAWTSYDRSAKLYPWEWNGMIRKGDHATELKTRVHPTQKPVGLFVSIFEDFDFETCIDGFLGSGSTLIACEIANKKCYGMEIDEKYCDVIVKRYINYCKKNEIETIIRLNGEKYNGNLTK